MWFEPRAVLGELGLEDTAADRRAYAQRMRERAVEELTAVPNAWLAEQLHLGPVSRVNHGARTAPPELLRKLEKTNEP